MAACACIPPPFATRTALYRAPPSPAPSSPASTAPPSPTSASSSSSHLPKQPAPVFAFARLHDAIHLVQLPSDAYASPLAPRDLTLFTHEFGTIFRYAAALSVHPADVQVLERIPDAQTRYEEDSGTVFLARPLLDRLAKLSTRAPQPHASPRARRVSRYSWTRAL